MLPMLLQSVCIITCSLCVAPGDALMTICHKTKPENRKTQTTVDGTRSVVEEVGGWCWWWWVPVGAEQRWGKTTPTWREREIEGEGERERELIMSYQVKILTNQKHTVFTPNVNQTAHYGEQGHIQLLHPIRLEDFFLYFFMITAFFSGTFRVGGWGGDVVFVSGFVYVFFFFPPWRREGGKNLRKPNFGHPFRPLDKEIAGELQESLVFVVPLSACVCFVCFLKITFYIEEENHIKTVLRILWGAVFFFPIVLVV